MANLRGDSSLVLRGDVPPGQHAGSHSGPVIGVLSLQGGVEEHLAVLEGLGASARRVRVPRDLEGLDGLVIPGGESSVFDKLARAFDLAEPLRAAIEGGLPVLATYAGLNLPRPRPRQPRAGAAHP